MNSEKIIITDIGSTTTKALLLQRQDGTYSFKGITTAYTTVEKPAEDVMIGLYNSLKALEAQTQTQLITADSSPDKLTFNEGCTYLTTSSAGGGLQILVIGLTTVDSAASAERAAYGVGGVVLGTIAIDDKRSAIEKLQVISTLHPDIILFCGGVEGGALFSVYRLAEILKLCDVRQKFSLTSKIPLVYAGNSMATDFIGTLFADKFDLHVVENIRPTMTTENPEPAKEKIHTLFMENVMEQAPGYPKVKRIVAADIIPTPAGVLHTLKLLGKKYSSVIAFDIGGATTDVFSNIIGRFHRTVSANLGMSYSIGNVLASADYQKDFAPYLNSSFLIPNSSFQNYVGNKNLYPDYQPQDITERFFEHIIAIKAIKLANEQHFKMHFNIKRIGFLDKLKNMASRDKFKETFYYPHYDKTYIFNMSQIEVVVASGGVISSATPEQAIFMIIESMSPQGLTHIWRDRHFISPHLGVLSTVAPETAEELLYSDCVERLAVYFRPILPKKKYIYCVKIGDTEHKIPVNEVFYYTPQQPQKAVWIADEQTYELELEQGIAFIFDARIDKNATTILKTINPYNTPFTEPQNMLVHYKSPIQFPSYTENVIPFTLPYPGQIMVSVGDSVKPETLLAENKFDPPQIYMVQLAALLGETLTEEVVRAGLQVKEGDTIAFGDLLYQTKTENLFAANNAIHSPVRGIVETINYKTGAIVLREIQDYPLKPVEISIAKPLKIKPKHIRGYLKKRLGDFVSAGELLAESSPLQRVVSQYTGTIREVDTVKGTVTICYDKKPFQIYAQSLGVVVKVVDTLQVDILTKSAILEGKIGFGVDRGGCFTPFENANEGCVTYCPCVESYEGLLALADIGINGLIVNTIPYDVLKRFLGKDIGVALTGHEVLPFSLVVLTGFSPEVVVDDSEVFLQFKRRYVLLKPKTQIRAGATRPQVVVFE